MKQQLLLLAVWTSLSFSVSAQAVKDKKNIEKLCGCYNVDFKYAETFAPDKNYKFHDRERLGGTELVLPVEISDKKYVLQHLLVINDTMIIKHWREDWVYESPVLFTYQGNKQWIRQTLPAQDIKNKWTQTVWEVDDAPRYQGIGQWISNDGKTYWESTTDAPLPRREYTTRNDYNILRRGNRIVLKDDQWAHEQDNQKIRRTSGNDTLVAEEKGINAYKKAADSKCAKAKEWWQKNGAFWNGVRAEWDNYFKNAGAIALKGKVKDKRLGQYFDELWEQWSAKTITLDKVKEQVKELIPQFATAAPSDVAGK